MVIFFALFFNPLWNFGQVKEPRISTDFPGGNIYIEKIAEDTVWLRPELRDTKGEWFYWYFKISGVSGRTITFQFTRNNVFTSFGPACSMNRPNEWKWLGESSVLENRFSYTFSNSDTCAYFSMGFPYTEKDLYQFFKNFEGRPELNMDTLCFTMQGHAVEELRINKNKNVDQKVLITARHHACEMMANYVMEGLITSILQESRLAWLRENVEFRIIPFIDKDGVENGDQGKNRIPRDHNRDYDGNSVYPVTRKLREEIPSWSEGRMKIALDLHCPWITGENNEWIYMVGSSKPENEARQIRFSKLIEENSRGELKFDHAHFLPFGKAWNTGENYVEGVSFDTWAQTIPGVNLSTTLEFPYADVSGIQVSKENAREFGEAVAIAIMEFLKPE